MQLKSVVPCLNITSALLTVITLSASIHLAGVESFELPIDPGFSVK
jgi:hypothetical protein